MSVPLIGFIATSVFALLLILLFRYERKRGRRFFEYGRERADFVVLKIEHGLRMLLSALSGGVIRQTLHYLFHAVLTGALGILHGIENRVKEISRTNRALAKRSLRERTTRNKLDEIALHKIEVALSEEEKKRHREKHLNG
jgi:hypothetical protein